MGLNLEDWLTIWMSNNVKSAPVRKLFAKNEYERALEVLETHEEKQGQKRSRGESRKRKSKGRKRKKSVYQVRR
jgi:hypothetical protein